MTSTTGDYVANCPIGVGISRRADSTFLIDNCFQWIEK